jgi:hypothetical protein
LSAHPEKQEINVQIGSKVFLRESSGVGNSEADSSGKAAGEVVAVNKVLGVGLAVMRLDLLFDRELGNDGSAELDDNTTRRSSSLASGNLGSTNKFMISVDEPHNPVLITPFKPDWWPQLNLINGQPLD